MKEFRRRQYEVEITYLKGSIQYAKEVKASMKDPYVHAGQDRQIAACERRLEHIYAKMRYLATE